MPRKPHPTRGRALRELAAHPKVLAVGEIGLDYHYDFSPRDVQTRHLRRTTGAGHGVRQAHRHPHARSVGRHRRDSARPLARRRHSALLHRQHNPGPAGTRPRISPQFRRRPHVSKAEEVRQSARIAPDDRILIETDCPYLAPVPHRGKRNEPAFVLDTARRLAEVRGVALEAIAEATTQNFEQLLFAGRVG